MGPGYRRASDEEVMGVHGQAGDTWAQTLRPRFREIEEAVSRET